MNKPIFFKSIVIAGFFTMGFWGVAQAGDKIRVVATTHNLADFASQIIGNDAEIYAVAASGRDIHFIQPTPRDVLKVKKAEVFIHTGLDLEAWRDPLLNAAGNVRFLEDRRWKIDTSQGITLLEVPDSLSRSEGDIHAFGNPHYWTDPENARKMVARIAVKLAGLYPERAGTIQKNAAALEAVLSAKLAEWSRRLAPFRGTSIITYHKSWPYFSERFGFEIAGYIEPKPGIPPTAKHLSALIQAGREKQVKLVINEAFQERRAADKVAREIGAVRVTLYQSAGEGGSKSYVEMMDKNVALIEQALATAHQEARHG